MRDHAQRLFAGFVGAAGQADGAFGGGERLVAGQEGEALGLFLEQHRRQVAVAEADLAVIRHGAGDAEGLHAFAQRAGDVDRLLLPLLQRNGAAQDVRPAGVLEGDGLDALDDGVDVDTLGVAKQFGFFQRLEAVLGQHLLDLGNSAFVRFKKSHGDFSFALFGDGGYS